MPKLKECLAKSSFSPQEQDYITSAAKALQDSGISASDAQIQAVQNLQDKTLDALRDVYDKVGVNIEGLPKRKEALPEVVEEKAQEEKPVAEQSGKPASTDKETKIANKKTRDRVEAMSDLSDPRGMALQYFAGGGKINVSAIKDLFASEGEKRRRIGLIKKGAPTVEAIAHQLWESHKTKQGDERYTDRDFVNAINEVLSEHVSAMSMAKALEKSYIETVASQDLSEAEINTLREIDLQTLKNQVGAIDAEVEQEILTFLESFRGDYGIIDWDAVQEATQGFDTNYLELSENGKKATDAIIERNQGTRQGQRADVLPESNRSQTNEQKATQELLDRAIEELSAAQSAFDSKRKELDKTLNADQQDLFGERKSSAANKLLDERVDPGAREAAIKPFKDRLSNAKAEVERLQKKMASLEGQATAQTNIFEEPKITDAQEVTKGIIGRIGKFLDRLFGGGVNGKVTVFKNEAELMKKAKQLGDAVRFKLGAANAIFETRDGTKIGYNYHTDKVARERFDLPSMKKLGSGSDRDVYDMGNGKVLKIAKTARGLEQNIWEGDAGLGGIIPDVFEKGLNYVVAEAVPRIKLTDKVPVYDDYSGAKTGKTVTAKQMMYDFMEFTGGDFFNRSPELQDTLRKYGFEDILNYDDILWGDWVRSANWGFKNGKPIHIDGGTFGGIQMLRAYEGKENMDDADFRDIYHRSRAAKKRYADKDRATMYQFVNDQTEAFYSPLQKFFENNTQNTFSKDQVLGLIKNLPQNEIEAIGLRDFMEGKTKVTRQELLDYIAQNKVQVEVVVKSDKKQHKDAIVLQEKHDKAQRVFIDLQDKIAGGYRIYKQETAHPKWGYRKPTDDGSKKDFIEIPEEHIAKLEAAQKDIDAYNEFVDHAYQSEEGAANSMGVTKYSQYTLPGEKTNYREVLLTLMEGRSAQEVEDDILKASIKLRDVTEELDEVSKKMFKTRYTNLGRSEQIDVSLKNYDIYARFRQAVAEEQTALLARNQRKRFVSSHFNEENIVAHIRLTDRVTPDGKTILFVEESQSDWAREQRKQGIKKVSPRQGEYDKLLAEETRLNNILSLVMRGVRQAGRHSASISSEIEAGNQEVIDAWEAYGITKDKRVELLTEIREAGEGVADMPFKNDKWVELVTKKAMQMAAQEGYDGIAWINGDQTRDRYDLSRHVNEIKVEKTEVDNLFFVDMQMSAGGTVYLEVENGVIREDESKRNLTGKKLEEVIGKEVAEKILTGGTQTLREVDLKIGGEWAIRLYDKQIPNLAQKYAKQYGGKVTEYRMTGEYNRTIPKPTVKELETAGTKISQGQQRARDVEVGKDKLAFTIVAGTPYRLYDEKDIMQALAAGDIYLMDRGFNESTQFGVEVTPQMKDKTKSLPLFMKDSKGKVLGFSFQGKVYLNGEHLNPNTPIHEAGHIWADWMKQNNPAIYAKGMELVQKSRYLKTIKATPFYKEQAAKLPVDQREEYFHQEALATAIGDQGAQFVTAAQKEGFREWLNNLWQTIKDAVGFTGISNKEFKNLTLEEFAKRAARDILSDDATPQQQDLASDFENFIRQKLPAFSFSDNSENKKYEDTAVVLSEAREHFKNNPVINRIIDLLEPVLADNPQIKIDTSRSPGDKIAGHSYPDGSIAINFDLHESKGDLFRSMIHELIHGVTRNEIERNVAFQDELGDILAAIRKELGLSPSTSVLQIQIKREINSEDPETAENAKALYGTSNEFELLAELFTNDRFYEVLKGIKYQKHTNILRAFYEKLMGALRRRYKAVYDAKKVDADNVADHLINLTEAVIKRRNLKVAGKGRISTKTGALALPARGSWNHEAIKQWITAKRAEGVPDPLIKSTLMSKLGESSQVVQAVMDRAAGLTGISHARTNEIANELGFEEYETSPQTQAEWNAEADRLISENFDVQKLLASMLNGTQSPNPVEQKIIAKYLAALVDEYDQTQSEDTMREYNRARKISDIEGRKLGKGLAARRGTQPLDNSLLGYMSREVDVTGSDILTDEQKAQVVKEYKEVKAAEAEEARIKEEIKQAKIKKKAERKVDKESKKTTTTPKPKKSHEEYVKDRQAIAKAIKDKWKKSSDDNMLTVVPIPYAKQLFAIAPDVIKLMGSVVDELTQEGRATLENVIAGIRETIKDVSPEITDTDIRDIIAGEYTPAKKTRNQLAERLRDLKDEAKLLVKLEAIENNTEEKTEKQKRATNREVTILRDKIEKIRRERAKEELDANKFWPEEIDSRAKKLRTMIERNNKEVRKIEEDVKAGRFAPAPKPTPLMEDMSLKRDFPELFKAAIHARDMAIKARLKRELRLAEEEYNNRSKWKKAWDIIIAPFTEVRSLKASFDYSAPLRQGVIPTAAELLTNPVNAGKRIARMFKASGSSAYFDRWMDTLRESPLFEIMNHSGLALADPNSITHKEEIFQSRYAQLIPGVKGSERAYTYYLNSHRVDMFSRGVDLMQAKGWTFDNRPEDYKHWAKTVNALTGRGELTGIFKGAGGLLSVGFFSPRLIAARLSFFNPRFYYNIPAPVRRMFYMDMAKFVGLGAAVLASFALFADDDDDESPIVELDWRSSDFGKIRIGNTRYDIWGGFQQYIKLIGVISSQERKTASGKIRSLENERTGENESVLTGIRFLRGKASPLVGSAWNVISGKNVVGEKVTLEDEAKEFLIPLIGLDVWDAVKEHGPTGVLSTGLPVMFGVGVQTYGETIGPKKSKPIQ